MSDAGGCAKVEDAEIFFERSTTSSEDVLTMEMAIRSGCVDKVEGLLNQMSVSVTLKALTTTYGNEITPILHAARCGNTAVFSSIVRVMRERLSLEEVKDIMTWKDYDGNSLLCHAVGSKSAAVTEAVMTTVEHDPCLQQVAGDADKWLNTSLSHYRGAFKKNDNKTAEEWGNIISVLLRHSARPSPRNLRGLAHDAIDGSTQLWGHFTDLVLCAVETTKNLLVPCMNVSVALTAAAAARGTREGEKKIMDSLREWLDACVLEVFEQLPQTVRSFEDRMFGCYGLLESNGNPVNPNRRPGLLQVAFKQRRQMEYTCSVPLVMDYLSKRFTRGLPNLLDADEIIRNNDDFHLPAHDSDDSVGTSFSFVDFKNGSDSLWKLLSGVTRDDTPTLTAFPVQQFIVAGMLMKPLSFYKIPALRMAMDYVIYYAMTLVYFDMVLLHDDGPVTIREILFAVYMLAVAIRECEELRRDSIKYLRDEWNYLDVVGLAMFGGGFIARLADSACPWGHALYALRLPLMGSRLLFLMSLHPFYGPMIQEIFSTGVALLQFAGILSVIILYFAGCFASMFKGDDSYEGVLAKTSLYLFRTMIGDMEYFDELEESSQENYATAGSVILVIFVIVVTILLLNLLIAIMNTAYSEAHTKGEKKFNAYKVRVIQWNRCIVDFDMLPAPFNLVQLFATLPLKAMVAKKSESCRIVKQAVGLVVCWLTLGPIAVILGTVLWVSSTPRILGILGDIMQKKNLRLFTRLVLSLICLTLCLLGTPVFFIAMWLKDPFTWVKQGIEFLYGLSSSKSTDPVQWQCPVEVDVQNMLKGKTFSIVDFKKYLRNPTIGHSVQRDDVYQHTTVQHLKLLKENLLQEINDKAMNLEHRLTSCESALRVEINGHFANVMDILEAIRGPGRAEGFSAN